MRFKKKRATPDGITLLAKPHTPLRSLLSVALSCVLVKAILVYHQIFLLSIFNRGGMHAQFQRSACTIENGHAALSKRYMHLFECFLG